MNKHQKSWMRAAASLTAVAVTTAILFWAGAAAAQGHMRITEDDLPGGDAGSGGDGGLIHTTIEYVTNNTYLSIGPHYLDYTGSSSSLVVDNPTGISAQAFAVGQELENTGAGLGNKTFAGGTLGIYVPWTGHHLAVEVLLAAPLEVTFETTGRAIDESLAVQTRTGIKTGVLPVGRTVGTLMALPPNFTIVYRPWVDTMIQPYIGIGAAYLYTYDTDVTNDSLTVFGNEPTLYLSKPVACMGQLGFDVVLPHDLFVNADVRYMGCAEITAELNDIQVDAGNLSKTFGPVQVGTISTTVDFEALIYSLNIGVQF